MREKKSSAFVELWQGQRLGVALAIYSLRHFTAMMTAPLQQNYERIH
jgi:hypothetical protein